jgi:hypothetical protein
MEGNNCKKSVIDYYSKMNCLAYSEGLIYAGDEKGRIAVFDIRVGKAVKVVITGDSSDVK